MTLPLETVLRRLFVLLLALSSAAVGAWAGDWPELRGPKRDGTSAEKGLPEKWSRQGENLAWRADYGGISGPVVLGDRVYLQNTAGEGAALQERVLCFDANTGKLLWERRISINHSDVPPHRAAWATPSLDPETGNVYVFAVNGTLAAFTRDGKPLWTRYLTEEFGLITTHGGRTVSPLIDGALVIVSGITFNWGELAGGSQRFMAFDKKNGETVWVSSPGARPYDTTYSPPMITSVNGARLLVAGSSDGAWHAMKVSTGEPVWRYVVSKRGLNTGALRIGADLILTHSEENMETSTMGFMAALDAAVKGDVKDTQARWLHHGFLGGFSSPVTDGQRIYQVDNGSLLGAFDIATGRQLWTRKLGTIQKAALVYADGKLYVGSENGTFYILRPRADSCDTLSEVELGNPSNPEEITAGVAVSNGRIYLATSKALYAIGSKARVPAWKPAANSPPRVSPDAPAFVQVIPADAVLAPGEKIKFRVRLFDAKGEFVREGDAQWTLEQLGGSVQPDGTYTAPAEAKGAAGQVKATVGGITGAARVRIVPPLPWEMNFEDFAAGTLPAWWVNARNKYAVKELDGNKVLTKLSDNQFSFIRRARAFAGRNTWSDYTTESDVRFTMRRRTMGDGGVVAQGYQLVLFANHERLELQSWQPETKRTVAARMAVKPDTWYRLKLRVERLPDGSVRARGKAWPVGEPEPDRWTLERTDPPGLGITLGGPGLYGDAPFDVHFDNFKVTPNR
jgi:outer membrane protein assembly factor BamB